MRKRKVLTVDDSKTMRDMVTFTLRDAGFDVVEAADGKLALQQLAAQSVNLVITDLNMPNMDGITLIRTLRSDPKHRGVPILMLTTEGDPSKKAAGKDAGATGWLVKPFDPAKLVELAKRVCP